MLGEESKIAARRRSEVATGGSSLTGKSWCRALATLGPHFGVLLVALSVGCPGYHYTSRAYFANTTKEPVNVRVQTLQADVDCASMDGRSAELLARRELFGAAITYEVEPGQAVPLDLDDPWHSQRRNSCAALVQILGFADQVVYWPSATGYVTTETALAEGSDPRFLGQSLRLEGYGNVKGLAVGHALEVTALPPQASGAPPADTAPATLGWSGAPRTGLGFMLFRREILPDGCLSLELGKDLDSRWVLFLCVPEWAFPFEVDTKLNITSDQILPEPRGYYSDPGDPPAQHLLVQAADAGARFELWLNAQAAELPAVGKVTSLGPPGRHTECGAYAEPVSVELPALSATLLPGEEAKQVVKGKTTRVLLGRADQLLIAPDACAPDFASLGTRFDLLMLDTPEVTP